ncbi:hypothetical protein ACE7GA_09365 [Roseomonas sp. CCTCC AB2023176]|uniref:hypothetical protein n=1 Tax=Roseomonas sp. CCTCC AB2023176 TaxID=3342640 RepID=UPI0035E048C5
MVGGALLFPRAPIPALQAIGAAPVALLGLAGLMAFVTLVTTLVHVKTGWPALAIWAALLVGAGGITLNTVVRDDRRTPPLPEGAASGRPTLEQAASAWLEHCARAGDGPVRAVVVASAGGASRAALWTASVMRRLEGIDPDGKVAEGADLDPARQLFALSGVSGGALGVAAYAASLARDGAGCRGIEGRAPQPATRHDALYEALGRDHLAAPLAGMLFSDAYWRLAFPAGLVSSALGWRPVERTGWLERSWEEAMVREDAGTLLGGLVRRTFPDAPAPAGSAPGASAPQASAPGAPGPTTPGPATSGPFAARPAIPVVITTGTHQESGNPVVTAAPRLPPASGAVDALAVLGRDIPLSVAASNSARFPYISAPGLLAGPGGAGPVGQIVDGGYTDNLGTLGARAAVRALEAAYRDRGWHHGLRIAVVQILSDPDRDPASVPRCDPRPGPVRLQPRRPGALDFVASPIGALTEVRGVRANEGVAEFVEEFCGTGAGPVRRDLYVFSLGPGASGAGAELSWSLSGGARGDIRTWNFRSDAAGLNSAELARFRRDGTVGSP